MGRTSNRGAVRGLVLLLGGALLVAACGGSPVPPADAGAPGSAPAGTDGTVTPTPAESTAPAWLPPQPMAPEAVAAWEDALVDRFAVSSGIDAALGDGGWAFVEDQIRTTIEDALAQNGVALGPGLVASTSSDLPATAAGGVAAMGIGMAMIMVGQALSDPTGPLSNMDANLNHTSERTVDGVRSVSTMSGRLASSIGNGRVTGTVGFGIDIESFDAATGASLGRITFSLTGTVDLELCPDVDGKVRGTVSMALSGGTPTAGSASLEVNAEITGLVNDAAFLTTIEGTGDTSDDTTSPSGARRTSSSSGNATGTMGSGGSFDPNGLSGVINVNSQTGDPLTQAEADERYARIGVAIGMAVWMLADDAQEQWRGGACVEIRATERSRDVKPRQHLQFEAQPWHKVEQVSLSKPVEASFAGEASLDPVDVPVPAPALFDYVASPTKDHSGTVSLKSTSNRGIGTLDITFTTRINGWYVDGTRANGIATGSVQGQHCGDPPGRWVVEGTYDAAGMHGTQKWVITIDASGTSGTYTYQQTSKGNPGGSPVTVTVQGTASGVVTLTIDPDTSIAHMHFKERQHDYRARAGRGWGVSQPLPLEESDLDWEPDPSC